MAKNCIFCSGNAASGECLIEDCESWICKGCMKAHSKTISQFREQITVLFDAVDEDEASEAIGKLDHILDHGGFATAAADNLQRFIGNEVECQDAEQKIAQRHAVQEKEVARVRMEEKKRTERLSGLNAQYEYTVDWVCDVNGVPDFNAIQRSLTEHAKKGWRLHTALTNELGKNAHSLGIGGFGTGTNETVEATILIYERCIRPERWNMQE